MELPPRDRCIACVAQEALMASHSPLMLDRQYGLAFLLGVAEALRSYHGGYPFMFCEDHKEDFDDALDAVGLDPAKVAPSRWEPAS